MSEDKIEKLQSLFYKYKEVEKVVIFGSRAKGNYDTFSDVDITLVGLSLDKTLLSNIIFAVDDLLLPYMFDISILHDISNSDVIDHINRRGKVLYDREEYSKELI